MRRNTACRWTPGGTTWRPEESTRFFVRRWSEFLSASLRSTASQQVSVPVFGHPFGAREMAFEGTPGPFGFAQWIDVQDDPRHFRPVRAFSVGIEQAQIGHEMFVVISGQIAGRGRLVGNPGIERR